MINFFGSIKFNSHALNIEKWRITRVCEFLLNFDEKVKIYMWMMCVVLCSWF